MTKVSYTANLTKVYLGKTLNHILLDGQKFVPDASTDASASKEASQKAQKKKVN